MNSTTADQQKSNFDFVRSVTTPRTQTIQITEGYD
jgi:hypothetical protein